MPRRLAWGTIRAPYWRRTRAGLPPGQIWLAQTPTDVHAWTWAGLSDQRPYRSPIIHHLGREARSAFGRQGRCSVAAQAHSSAVRPAQGFRDHRPKPNPSPRAPPDITPSQTQSPRAPLAVQSNGVLASALRRKNSQLVLLGDGKGRQKPLTCVRRCAMVGFSHQTSSPGFEFTHCCKSLKEKDLRQQPRMGDARFGFGTADSLTEPKSQAYLESGGKRRKRGKRRKGDKP